VIETDGGSHYIRLADGALLPATTSAPIQHGARGFAALRPDHLALVPAGQGALPARLMDAVFHGDHWRLLIALDCGVEVQLKLPLGQIGAAPERGALLGLALSERPLQIWPEQGW